MLPKWSLGWTYLREPIGVSCRLRMGASMWRSARELTFSPLQWPGAPRPIPPPRVCGTVPAVSSALRKCCRPWARMPSICGGSTRVECGTAQAACWRLASRRQTCLADHFPGIASRNYGSVSGHACQLGCVESQWPDSPIICPVPCRGRV